MKRHFLFLFMLVMAAVVHAQTVDTSLYIIRFKDGSEVKGRIVEKDPAKYIKVDVKGKIVTYTIDELAGVSKEADVKKAAAIAAAAPHQRPKFAFKKKGYIGSVEIGVSAPFIPNVNGKNVLVPQFAINVINAYQSSPYFAIGVGLGAEFNGQASAIVSAYEDMRIYFTRSSDAAFLELPLGYTALISKVPDAYYGVVPESTLVYHGMMFNPSLGGRVCVSKKLAISMSIGYKLWYFHVVAKDVYGQSVDDFVALHGFTIKGGVMF